MTDHGFGDFFGGGGGGAAGVTWDGEKKGAAYEGVIVPFDLTQPDLGYETTQKTNTQGDALYWNPNRSAKFKMVTASDLGGQEAKPILQAEITILTQYRNNEFMTDNRIARMKENDETDDGLRRVFVTGPYLPNALRDAMRKVGASKPEVGATIRVTLLDKEPNEHGGKTNVVGVEYASPTPATMKLVEKYIAENADSDDDPFSTPEGDDEAPF